MSSVSHLNFLNPKLLHPNLSIKSKLLNRQSQLNFSFHTKTKKLLQVSSNLNPQIPTSNFKKRDVFLAKFLCVKILCSVLGAFVFMGSFGFFARPSLALSNSNIEEEENSESEEMYEKLLEKEPRHVEALKAVVFGKIRKREKIMDALKYVERLIKIEPNEVEWRLLEALCYELMGQFSKAKKLFKDILKERPLLLRALHGLAMVMHKNLEGPTVFDMLDNALEVAYHEKRVVEERNIRILIAQMHVVKGQLVEGLKKFQDLVDENPQDFRPYLCQGIIYSLLDKKEEAAEQFEIYQSLVPEEFPQRSFLDDVVLTAKTESGEQFKKDLETECSYK